MQYLIRIEGLNLGHFIYDTQDLSVIRGGSLAMLDLSNVPMESLKCVSAGASQAIFTYDSDRPPDLAVVRTQLLASFQQGQTLRHPLKDATVSIECVEFPDPLEFAKARAVLISRARWTQMQTPSLVYPRLEAAKVANQIVCERDRVRPAAKTLRHWSPLDGESFETLSELTYERHEWGREQKKTFFKREFERLGDSSLNDVLFANDLHEIAGGSKHKQPLRDKMAVIYVDGNGFGKRFLETCRDVGSQEAASNKLRNDQVRFLLDFLTPNAADRDNSEWFFTRKTENGGEDRVFRLEVLLWGGDEIILIVPSWQGLATLDFFFKATGKWKPFPDDKPVTHKAGLVFCNQKSHIHKAARLAHDLAGFAKMEGQNTFAYQVLESFDHLGQPPEDHYTHPVTGRYHFSKKREAFILNGDGIRDFWGHGANLRGQVPRRQLHAYARKLISNVGSAEQPKGDFQNDWTGFRKHLLPPTALAPETTADASWIHLVELWDYFPQDPGGLH